MATIRDDCKEIGPAGRLVAAIIAHRFTNGKRNSGATRVARPTLLLARPAESSPCQQELFAAARSRWDSSSLVNASTMRNRCATFWAHCQRSNGSQSRSVCRAVQMTSKRSAYMANRCCGESARTHSAFSRFVSCSSIVQFCCGTVAIQPIIPFHYASMTVTWTPHTASRPGASPPFAGRGSG